MTKIEWTDKTWNPTTGCNKVSAGCKNCYAEIFAERLQAMGANGYHAGFEFTVHPDRLELPKLWKKPARVFVNSMSDLFHEKMPIDFLFKVFETMRECPQHVFQVLTKRSDRMRALSLPLNWPANVWAGVSVENEAAATRIDDLRAVPAKVRFLSCEPLLGPLPELDLTGIHWVIVGGESGAAKRIRPLQPEWVRQIRDHCMESGVPFFFKQWSKPSPEHRNYGRILDGTEHNAFPE